MSGQWDRFEVTYDDLYSPVGEKVATFAPNSLTGDIQFDRFGVVYTLEVRSVSTNGVKSLSEIEHKLVTGQYEFFSQAVMFCFYCSFLRFSE